MRKIIAVIAITILLLPLAVSAESDILTYGLSGIDVERGSNMLVAYTSGVTGTDGSGTEAVIAADGTVISIGGSNNAVPEGGFVLSGSSIKKAWIEKNIKVGYKVMLDKDSKTITVVPDDMDPFKTVQLEYTGINATRAENTCIIYRGKPTTETNTWGFEVVVGSDGYITSVGGNNNAIPDGGFVISAIGSYKQPLEDAAEVGMSVKLDEKTKTVTLAFDKAAALKRASLICQDAQQQFGDAQKSFLYIDLAAAGAQISKLEKYAADIETALNKDDIQAYVYAAHCFDAAAADISDMLYEIPAVEARCLWLRPAKYTESAIKSAVREIYDAGFNSVAIELLFDNTLYCPAPEGSLFETNPMCGDKDQLKLWIDELHSYGIEVHGWMSSLRVAHSASSNTQAAVTEKMPQWRIIANDGRDYLVSDGIKHYYLNIAMPEVRSFLLDTYKYIIETYDLDGFQLDYIRYPDAYSDGIYYGYDEYTKQLFETETGINVDSITKNSAEWTKWCRFKADIVTDFVKDITAMAHEADEDIYVSASVAPQYDESVVKKHQDTSRWLKEGLIDIVFPMSYGTTDAVKKWTGVTLEQSADGVLSFMGIRDGGFETVKETIAEVRKLGADGVAFFSYSQYVAGDYKGKIDKTVFRERAVSPTYDPTAAVKAQLQRTYDRGSQLINDSRLQPSLDEISALISRLDNEKLSETKDDILSAVGRYTSAAKEISDAAYAALAADETKLHRIISGARRDAASVPVTMPESTDTESTPSDVSPDSSDESTGNGIWGNATGFDKFMIGLMLVILSFSALCAPIYVILDLKKRREKRDRDRKDEK